MISLYLWRAYTGQRFARTFALASSIVLIPLFALCLKNVFIYGFFGTSSWSGMSLWLKTNGYNKEQLEDFYTKGIISSLALKAELDPFQPIHYFFLGDKLKAIPCHHPADCNEWRSTGYPNFNHSGFVYLSKQLQKDAVSLMKYDPGMFAFYTIGSYSLTLWYSSDSVRTLFEENMQTSEMLEKIYRFLYFGFMGVQSRHSDPRMWLRTIAITVLILFFYISTVRNLWQKNTAVPLSVSIVCLFCLLIHAYTLGISALIEFGENNRFRFPVDGAFIVLMAGNMVVWGKILRQRLEDKRL